MPSHLTTDPLLARRIPSLATFDFATRVRRAPWSLGLTVTNMFGADADSFAYGNPFSLALAAQHVPLRPRSIGIRIGWNGF